MASNDQLINACYFILFILVCVGLGWGLADIAHSLSVWLWMRRRKRALKRVVAQLKPEPHSWCLCNHCEPYLASEARDDGVLMEHEWWCANCYGITKRVRYIGTTGATLTITRSAS